MKQYYFIYNNKKYDSGTVIKIRKFDYMSQSDVTKEAVFYYHDTERNSYVCQIDNYIAHYTSEKFYNMIVHVTDTVVILKRKQENKTPTFTDELSIDGMLIAWIWYVFIMAIAVIFNDRIAIWIFATFIFVNYRNKKLRKVGYKK